MTSCSTSIGFNCNPLERRSEKRDDGAFIERLRSDPAARFLVFDGDVFNSPTIFGDMWALDAN